jgi:XisH protein
LLIFATSYSIKIQFFKMAKDKYHDLVRTALEKEGWTVTHDPYKIKIGRRKGYIDLGAEREMIGAERGNEKIAVEIKSFLGASDLYEFEDALGQFIIYCLALEEMDPERVLYLAVPVKFYERFFDDAFFVRLLKRFSIHLIIYNLTTLQIEKWIKS